MKEKKMVQNQKKTMISLIYEKRQINKTKIKQNKFWLLRTKLRGAKI